MPQDRRSTIDPTREAPVIAIKATRPQPAPARPTVETTPNATPLLRNNADQSFRRRPAINRRCVRPSTIDPSKPPGGQYTAASPCSLATAGLAQLRDGRSFDAPSSAARWGLLVASLRSVPTRGLPQGQVERTGPPPTFECPVALRVPLGAERSDIAASCGSVPASAGGSGRGGPCSGPGACCASFSVPPASPSAWGPSPLGRGPLPAAAWLSRQTGGPCPRRAPPGGGGPSPLRGSPPARAGATPPRPPQRQLRRRGVASATFLRVGLPM